MKFCAYQCGAQNRPLIKFACLQNSVQGREGSLVFTETPPPPRPNPAPKTALQTPRAAPPIACFNKPVRTGANALPSPFTRRENYNRPQNSLEEFSKNHKIKFSPHGSSDRGVLSAWLTTPYSRGLWEDAREGLSVPRGTPVAVRPFQFFRISRYSRVAGRVRELSRSNQDARLSN